MEQTTTFNQNSYILRSQSQPRPSAVCLVNPFERFEFHSKVRQAHQLPYQTLHAFHSAFKSKIQREKYHSVAMTVMKNCEPLVSEPAFAIDKTPAPSCLKSKFSSLKFFP